MDTQISIFFKSTFKGLFEKNERQVLRTRKHYIQIFIWMILLVFSWDIHVWKVVNC